MRPFDRGAVCLLRETGGYASPDAAGVWLFVVILMRSESKGRRAGREPAVIPIPSSIRDQNPILPVPYMNSPGLLYSVRYLRRTIVAQEALGWLVRGLDRGRGCDVH